jgi:hypothetical protein
MGQHRGRSGGLSSAVPSRQLRRLYRLIRCIGCSAAIGCMLIVVSALATQEPNLIFTTDESTADDEISVATSL